jgi:hypothetical protein
MAEGEGDVDPAASLECTETLSPLRDMLRPFLLSFVRVRSPQVVCRVAAHCHHVAVGMSKRLRSHGPTCTGRVRCSCSLRVALAQHMLMARLLALTGTRPVPTKRMARWEVVCVWYWVFVVCFLFFLLHHHPKKPHAYGRFFARTVMVCGTIRSARWLCARPPTCCVR